MRVLKWKDPWQRSYFELFKSHDTGFCNRIFHWEIASFINDNFCDGKYQIAVEESQWPELKELIELPKTFVISKDKEFDYFTKLSNVEIYDSKLLDIFSKKYKINFDKNYVSNFKYTDIGVLEDEGYIKTSKRPLSKLKIQNKELQHNIESQVSDLVGIHVRRARGVIIPSYMYDDDEYTDYIEFRKEQGAIENSMFEYVEDDTYFKVIDSILKINKNQKFYLSYDVPFKFILKFKERYGDIILTKKDIKSNLDLSSIKNSIDLHIDNTIDLFSLSNTKYLLTYPISTWSMFAKEYKSKESNCILDDVSIIIETYNKQK